MWKNGSLVGSSRARSRGLMTLRARDQRPGTRVRVLARIRTYASFIRFSHTVFALPFALTGALLASRTVPLTWGRIGWIVAAMVTAPYGCDGLQSIGGRAL